MIYFYLSLSCIAVALIIVALILLIKKDTRLINGCHPSSEYNLNMLTKGFAIAFFIGAFGILITMILVYITDDLVFMFPMFVCIFISLCLCIYTYENYNQ